MDWADDEATRHLGQDAPVLGILHSITGASSDYREFMGYAAKRGWMLEALKLVPRPLRTVRALNPSLDGSPKVRKTENHGGFEAKY